MKFNDYQVVAHSFAAYPTTGAGPFYPILALAEEAGEVCGKVAKAIRKGTGVDEEALKKELGDLLWQLSEVATLFDMDLEDIATTNIEKLTDREQRGVVIGEGDNR